MTHKIPDDMFVEKPSDNSDEIIIIESEEADAAGILRLQYAAYQSEAELYDNFNIQPLTQTIDELLAEYRKGAVLKAVLRDEIIGSVRIHRDGDTVYIGKLIVHPDRQGRGLGSRLLAEAERMFASNRYELFTGSKSASNLHIYEKAGYSRFKEKTAEPGLIFVYMEKIVK